MFGGIGIPIIGGMPMPGGGGGGTIGTAIGGFNIGGASANS